MMKIVTRGAVGLAALASAAVLYFGFRDSGSDLNNRIDLAKTAQTYPMCGIVKTSDSDYWLGLTDRRGKSRPDGVYPNCTIDFYISHWKQNPEVVNVTLQCSNSEPESYQLKPKTLGARTDILPEKLEKIKNAILSDFEIERSSGCTPPNDATP